MAQAPHVPTDELRQLVDKLSSAGIKVDTIAAVIGISDETVRKYYGDILKISTAVKVAKVADVVYASALGGNMTACIFFLKCRGQWSGPKDYDAKEEAEDTTVGDIKIEVIKSAKGTTPQ